MTDDWRLLPTKESFAGSRSFQGDDGFLSFLECTRKQIRLFFFFLQGVKEMTVYVRPPILSFLNFPLIILTLLLVSYGEQASSQGVSQSRGTAAFPF